MSDKAEQKLIAELNLPWRDCETAAGKGKVVDRSGFSVCNTSGGCYAEQRERAKFIRIAANNHYKLVDALEACLRLIEKNTCLHEETERRGIIWEKCLACGRMWADDEGGKPEFKWPAEVEQARKALAEVKS